MTRLPKSTNDIIVSVVVQNIVWPILPKIAQLNEQFMRCSIMSPSHITPAGGNVFADLNVPDAEYEKIRALLLISVLNWFETSGMTHKLAASSMGIKPSVLKDALNGKFQEFTIDQLVRMLVSVGMNISISVTTDTP